MENDSEPYIKNPKRAFRNWFIGLFLLGMIAVPSVYFSDARHDPDWSPIPFVALGVGIAFFYALFLSFLTVGSSLLMDRRRLRKTKLFFVVLCGLPLLLNVSLLLLVKLSTPDNIVERIKFLVPIILSIVALMLLVLIGAACLGWRKYLVEVVRKSVE